jgi:signal transduction histidine kinase/HAMP domain-containing protein
MRLGLTGRILVGGVVLAAVLLTQVVFTYNSLRTIRHTTRDEERVEASIVSALRVQKLTLQLQSGARGYAIAREPRFLAQWRTARRALPAESARLSSYAPGSLGAALDRELDPTLARSDAFVRLARASPARARAQIAARGGRHVSRIEQLVDGYVAGQHAVLAADRAAADHAERTGVLFGAFGIVMRALVFLAAIAYLLRAIVRPLRRIAARTRDVAGGNLGVQVPETGPGEVGELARSFNEMSRSLERSRNELAEQNLRLEQGAIVLRAVLDSTVDGILLSNVDGRVLLANRPMIQLAEELELTNQGSVTDRLATVADRMTDRKRFLATMERLRSNPSEATFDEFEDAVSGRVFQGFTSPVVADDGKALGRLWTLRDVTAQRELDRLKDDFVATVSHELRTPLTSMMGFLEMLRAGEAGQLTPEQERFLAIVYRSSERLQRLVGDLLFIGRLDATGLELELEPVGLHEIVREAVEAHAALAQSRDLELVAELAPVPAFRGDSERLAQLVGNLVSNALKFTPPGGRVCARTFVEGAAAVVEVEDTGIGIPAPEQARIFERFFRSSTATEQAIPGTGLGLVISKAIAEAHHGSITIRSGPGHGTTVRVVLPLADAALAA